MTYMIELRVQVDAATLDAAEARADELVPYLQPATASLYTLPAGVTTAYVDDVREITQ